MRYLLRICDRCGAEIERQRGFRAYDTIIQSGPEFCDSCKRDFAEFMEEGKKVENRECKYLNFCPKCGHPMFWAVCPSCLARKGRVSDALCAFWRASDGLPPEIDLARNPYSCSHMTDRLYCTVYDASMRCCHDACYSCEHFDGEREER